MTAHPRRRTLVLIVSAGLFFLAAAYSTFKCFKIAEQRLLAEVAGIGSSNAQLIGALLELESAAQPGVAAEPEAASEALATASAASSGGGVEKVEVPAAVNELVKKLRFRQLGHAFLMDEHSRMVAHPIPELAGKSLSEEFSGDLARTSTLQAVQSSLGKRLLAFFPLPTTESRNWFLVADLNGSEAYDTRRYAALAGLSFLLTGLLAGLALRRAN